MRTRLAVIVATIAAFAASFGLRSWTEHIRSQEEISDETRRALVPSAASLRVVSLGHVEAAADLLWINALSYFGGESGRAEDPSWLDPHIDTILDLDPEYRIVYAWAGTVIMYSTDFQRDAVLASTRYLEEGTRRFPTDWELHAMAFFNYWHELEPNDEGEAERFQERALDHLRQATELPGAPNDLSLLYRTLQSQLSEGAVDWPGVASDYIGVADATAALNIRARLVLATSLDVEVPLTLRELRNELQVSPDLPFGDPVVSMALHPEPVYRYPPEALEPGPFSETR